MSEIIFGDCLQKMLDLERHSVDCIITDPPYGDTSLTWDIPVRDWLRVVEHVLKPSGSVWVFGSFRMFMEQAATFAGWSYAQEIVWEKHNGSGFHADRFKRVHEFAVQWYRGPWADVYKAPVTVMEATARTVRRKQRPPHTGHIEAGSYASEDGGPKLMRSVIYARSCHGYADHPTQKPTAILRPLIEYSCPPGGLVLDPFAGSGSTGVAAREVGRDYLLIEIDEGYCRVAEKRLAQLTI